MFSGGRDGRSGAHGRDGRNGRDGRDGRDGKDGASAYDLAVARGFAGTEDQWLATIRGRDGRDGKDGRDADLAFVRTEVQRAIDALPKAKDGRDGRDGKDGKDGRNGRDGKDGKEGRTILNGDGPPGVKLGQVGDFYIDKQNWYIYGPKDEKGWPSGVRLRGLDGIGGSLPSNGNGNGTVSEWGDLTGTITDQTDLVDYITTRINALIDAAPGTLDTLNELAAALGDDANFATTVTNALAGKVPTTRTVNGHALSGDVTVSKSDVGLGNVDNTSDANKPVSTATQTALDAKAAAADLTSHTSDTSNPHSVTKTQVGLGNVTNHAQTQAAVVPNTAPTNGQLLIGHTANGSYSVATLTAGSNVTITNGAGSITIAATGGSSTPEVITDSPSSDQNDYSPTGWDDATTLRLTHTAPIVITGFASATAGEKKTLINCAAEYPLVIADEAVTSSSAANRVKTDPAGLTRGHLLLLPGDCVVIEYDGTSSRWRVVTVTEGAWRRGLRLVSLMVGDPSANVFRVGPNISTAGSSVSGASPSSGAYRTERLRVNFGTGTGAGASAGVRSFTAFVMRGSAAGRGGFLARVQFGGLTVPSTAASLYLGVRATTAAIGNVDISSLTDVFGVGLDPTQSTLRRVNNDSSSTATMTDLGANYPFDESSCYDFHMIATPGGSGMSGVLWRQDDLSITPKLWYESSEIPTGGTALAWQANINNRAAAVNYGFIHYGAEVYAS